MFIPERDLLCKRPDLSRCLLRDVSAVGESTLFVEATPEAVEVGIFAVQSSISSIDNKKRSINDQSNRNIWRRGRHGRRKNNIVDEEDQPPYSQLNRRRNGKAEPAAYTLY